MDLFPALGSGVDLHPMVVHFPIAFWAAGAGVWLWALFRRSDDAWRLGLWMQTFGLAGALVAATLGFIASNQLGHDSPGHELVHVHRDFMLTATGVAVLVTGLAWWQRHATTMWRAILTALSVALFAVMALGADRGAALVFNNGVGVDTSRAARSGGGGHSHSDNADDHDHQAPAKAADDHPHGNDDQPHGNDDHPH